jgi:hypothetical protein
MFAEMLSLIARLRGRLHRHEGRRGHERQKRCVSASWSRQPPASTGAMCRCLANKKGRSLPGKRRESGESRFTNVTEFGSRSAVAPGVARCYLPLVWDRHPHPTTSMASNRAAAPHSQGRTDRGRRSPAARLLSRPRAGSSAANPVKPGTRSAEPKARVRRRASSVRSYVGRRATGI